jgi:hypothetical protein
MYIQGAGGGEVAGGNRLPDVTVVVEDGLRGSYAG